MIKEELQENFVAGLIITAPLIVTVFILNVLFDWSLLAINPLVEGTRLAAYTGNIEIAAQVIAGATVLLFITLVGLLSRTRFGSSIIGDFGRVANVIPIFRSIYFTIRQVSDGIVERDSRFKRGVLVEYPRENVYSLAFVTGEAPAEVEEKAGEQLYNIFIPNSPNPTGGEFKMMPEEEMEDIDMSIRKALRLSMTTGITSDRPEI